MACRDTSNQPRLAWLHREKRSRYFATCESQSHIALASKHGHSIPTMGIPAYCLLRYHIPVRCNTTPCPEAGTDFIASCFIVDFIPVSCGRILFQETTGFFDYANNFYRQYIGVNEEYSAILKQSVTQDKKDGSSQKQTLQSHRNGQSRLTFSNFRFLILSNLFISLQVHIQ